MVRRRAKKTVKQAPKLPEHLGDGDTKEGQNEEKEKDMPLIYQEGNVLPKYYCFAALIFSHQAQNFLERFWSVCCRH